MAGRGRAAGPCSASVYRAVVEAVVDAAAVRRAATALLAEPVLPRERRKGETTVAYDLRPFIEAIKVDDVDAAVEAVPFPAMDWEDQGSR